VSDLDEFRSETLARQAAAEEAFHQGDPGPRMEMWSRRDPVTLFGAAGMYKYGSIDGRPVEPITVRSTHVYRREDGEWKIVHRHGDNPPPDPSSSIEGSTQLQ
jgi:ketosteroid isomerase-like protein